MVAGTLSYRGTQGELVERLVNSSDRRSYRHELRRDHMALKDLSINLTLAVPFLPFLTSCCSDRFVYKKSGRRRTKTRFIKQRTAAPDRQTESHNQ